MMMNTTTKINPQLLRNSFLFKDADDAVLEKVATFCQYMPLNAGEQLFEQGSPADAMYILESGQVHVIREYPDGYEVIIATESPYYVIGELSLLADQPRTGKVVAVADCDLIMLSRQAILDVYAEMPQIAVRALTQLGNRLYRLNLKVRENAIGNIKARIASVLLLLAENHHEQIMLPITRLARATAIDADVVERTLHQWSNQGIIHLDGQRVTVQDMATLRNLAG
ncbi:MAG: Crp/Fnr family transcriptional regulator [Chloroflexi bacterium]|nr:MAG: Crp/Fnr family transcriptional regulator [Chloroflexota bacterium]